MTEQQKIITLIVLIMVGAILAGGTLLFIIPHFLRIIMFVGNHPILTGLPFIVALGAYTLIGIKTER